MPASAIQVTNGTALHVLYGRERQTALQNLKIQSGTPFQESRRLITVLRGHHRMNQNITQVPARSIAAINANFIMCGMALHAINVQSQSGMDLGAASVQNGTDQPVYFPSAVRLHQLRAKIRQPAISGQQEH